ncbi:B3/B4 domain-containing protein [Actinoallomurus rhizosphaericola]|uniref:B3/B4 domain-containing protein n=1 Tax=Actinoallomurus rhizosphaericola TaxID=2952536 RepID=UPI0020922A71|nr:phenylalanine--tRNA ligase beta subunit-related protein [Actinoallomurus rhizosphaericola]MCO5996941.1 phenylalanine--tRNA ligase beta subunit-related protein [Actinoallomurus rhizosphaericola]
MTADPTTDSLMYFQHSDEIWSDHPQLVAGVLTATRITADAVVEPRIEAFTMLAKARLAGGTEADLPEIQAWRRAFSTMGLKPTRYRCASESLLRRFRKDGALPRIHPLVDLCNAVSLAFAIPVAALDVARISGHLEVRHAAGDESYLTLSGEPESPEPGEVTFVDAAGHAHARRWTNRQSGHSAVRATTRTVLIVTEAMHASAAKDVPDLIATLAEALSSVWPTTVRTATLSRSAPRFDLPVQPSGTEDETPR